MYSELRAETKVPLGFQRSGAEVWQLPLLLAGQGRDPAAQVLQFGTRPQHSQVPSLLQESLAHMPHHLTGAPNLVARALHVFLAYRKKEYGTINLLEQTPSSETITLRRLPEGPA